MGGLSGAFNSSTNLALSSFWHQSRWGGGQRQPGLVACAVEPGTLDLVVSGARGVAVASMYEGRVLWGFILVGNETQRSSWTQVGDLTSQDKWNRRLSLWVQC